VIDDLETPFEIERNPEPKARLSFLDRVFVEKGTLDDWRLLEGLHYKAHGITPGSHYFRLDLDGETIGVLMMASPKLLLKERHVMFPKLKPGKDTRISNTKRMKWINANMSIVSRCVVDTMYRGAGLAYRFANIASRMEKKQYIEIQSSMSKYNQFAQRAGFKFCPPMKSNKFGVGIAFFKSMFEADPADTEGIINEIMAMPEARREYVIGEVRKFYRKHSMLENTGKALIDDFGDRRVARLPVRELIYQLQQMVLASPLYGVYKNPDFDRELPERVPLLAFDNQPVNQPLDI
jgi:ABC-type ATPase with predicted acetyltransferase domain